ncbi:parvulin-like peptidyl-prolyl isomerase [Streptococcus pneumoniae]|uniref:peptidylprolyl isomerase n=1 Tax=Streptococcus pneumoniae TaxID=1313 RepID=UPI000B596259|nr:peptidylprolyl isomerase [Streptococcus pneumoniae]SND04655.1 parvulin-like peptidyl-prolyl isomerase [Streptococcus pneumoniae]SND15674.1 parvulin-like peptidyl-prolyl isomerase [Streptococcus pneumoniae]SND86809.1 parvulin-like peptidyl-prolyl isomerase [Streptococcus pneumoniae]SNE75749.1 parvulin-like peptidyl-prolyl isomerase [Streptococcus pneumoniae]SPR73439.1 parvulin-like peptidyl-prolyl isomerase [Streptococcus pneumoniae]
MLNKVKTKALISVGAVAATSFILMMGYTAGQHSTAKQSRKEIELAAAKLVEDKQAEDKASILSSDTVKEFLTQYYTKEKLGENNTRIQPYMTESAYSQELSSQNDAMNQVYKNYILDYHFENADIFVNQTTNQAIAMVSYNVTYVSDLKNANQSKTNQTETRTVKLSYSKLPCELLVNQVQVWKSGLDDLDKATPKTLEESSSISSLPNTTTK